MNHKIGAILVSAMALFTLLSSARMVFAQPWDACIVSSHVTDLEVDETNGFFSFTAVDPLSPGVVNFVSVANYAKDESHAMNLSQGDAVVVSYTDFAADDLSVSPIEPGLDLIYYNGPADSVTINTVEIPEFPSFLILPLFMIATLLAAIVYRRTRTSQVKQRID